MSVVIAVSAVVIGAEWDGRYSWIMKPCGFYTTTKLAVDRIPLSNDVKPGSAGSIKTSFK